jgi:hypothetical protein
MSTVRSVRRVAKGADPAEAFKDLGNKHDGKGTAAAGTSSFRGGSRKLGGKPGSGGGSGSGSGGKSGKDDKDDTGRMDRESELEEKVSILKKASGLSDSDVQWKMQSAKGNAYNIAGQRVNTAEAGYYRSLWWAQAISTHVNRLTDRNLEKHLNGLLKAAEGLKKEEDAGADCGEASTNSDTQKENFLRVQGLLRDIVSKYQANPLFTADAAAAVAGKSDKAPLTKSRAASSPLHILTTMSQFFPTTLNTLLEADAGKSRKGKPDVKELVMHVRVKVKTELRKMEIKLKAEQNQIDVKLSEMELWQRRKNEAPEKEKEEALAEARWARANLSKNKTALDTMSRFIPRNVRALTVSQLKMLAVESASKENESKADAPTEGANDSGALKENESDGDASQESENTGDALNLEKNDFEAIVGSTKKQVGPFPTRLALHLKQTPLLHWIVTPMDDIARSNFLTGPNAHHFTNLEQYDLTEMRAVYLRLPSKFEFDRDGKKACWRQQFVQRLQSLVDQDNGVEIAGGWDPILSRRMKVKLPELKHENVRREVYHYPSKADIQGQLSRMGDTEVAIAKKRARLEALTGGDGAEGAKGLIAQSKDEYNASCEDARSSYLREEHGKELLVSLRDTAKECYEKLCRERTSLERWLASGDSKIVSSEGLSKEEFVQEINSIEAFLSSKNGAQETNQDLEQSETNPALAMSRTLVQGPFDPSSCALDARSSEMIGSSSGSTTHAEAKQEDAPLVEVHARKMSASEEAAARRKEIEQLMSRKKKVLPTGTPALESGAAEKAPLKAPKPNFLTEIRSKASQINGTAVGDVTQSPPKGITILLKRNTTGDGLNFSCAKQLNPPSLSSSPLPQISPFPLQDQLR